MLSGQLFELNLHRDRVAPEKLDNLASLSRCFFYKGSSKGEDMTQDEIDRDFYKLLSDGGWVDNETYKLWIGIKMQRGKTLITNPMRYKRIAKAIQSGVIRFQVVNNRCVAGLSPLENGKNGSRAGVVYFEQLLIRTSRKNELVLEAGSLLTWLENNYPLPPESVPEPNNKKQFMSDELAIALECSLALYPSKPDYELKRATESTNIKEWIEDSGLDDTAKGRVTKMVNPAKKPTGKKK